MNHVYEKVEKCVKSIQKQIEFVPEVGLVMGSGLGKFADTVQVVKRIKYRDIEGFPISTVEGHQGRLVFGYIGAVKVVVMQGRIHFYEGYDMSDVVLPIRVMCRLGIQRLLLTNAVGGINPSFHVGDFMMITDHIAALIQSPLIGANIESYGTRFPDMTEVYDKDLREKIREAARVCDIELKEGVYLQTTGPNYETPAEIRLYKMWGADAVGMSTACEAMAAHHMGVAVCGVSCITNMASGISQEKLSHDDVTAIANKNKFIFASLVENIVKKM